MNSVIDFGLIRLWVKDGVYVWKQNGENVSPQFRSREEAEGWASDTHGPVMYPVIQNRHETFDRFVKESGKMIRESFEKSPNTTQVKAKWWHKLKIWFLSFGKSL